MSTMPAENGSETQKTGSCRMGVFSSICWARVGTKRANAPALMTKTSQSTRAAR